MAKSDAMLAVFLAAALAGAPTSAAAGPPSPTRILGLIRAKFRSHRPPPPYVTYTLIRKENTYQGYPDYEDSYTDKVWYRSWDHAALKERVAHQIYRGPMTFDRPAFNEARDPGPPTADLFEPAPAQPHPVTFVPTPEPTGTIPPTIAAVKTFGEFDYRVVSTDTQGDTLHLKVEPTRDPDRNRLRELWVNKDTYELARVVATDKLFLLGTNEVYPVLFTIYLKMLDGIPAVTYIHGVVGGGYSGDGGTVDYWFTNIAFPATLPAWYFDPREYGSYQAKAPSYSTPFGACAENAPLPCQGQ